MKRLFHPLLFLTLILSACSSSPNISTSEALPTATFTPDLSAAAQCAYQWANQDIPELTAQLDTAIKAVIPHSTSRASAFGENCIGNNGRVLRFGAMETDFYVAVSVESLTDYETFGNWIVQAMQAINSMPPDLLMGPNKGFVEFSFKKSSSDAINFRVPIQQYNDSANGISGEKLFRMFYVTP